MSDMNNKLGNKNTAKNQWYMELAELIAKRSIDPKTKVGAIITDSNKNYILSIGYNGTIRGFDDSLVDLNSPEKYNYIIHAEENAILNYKGTLSDLKDSIIYVTHQPCVNCLKRLLQVGIKTIYYLNEYKNLNDTDKEAENLMIKHFGVNIQQLKLNL